MTGIACPCGIADLRVVRTTHTDQGVERERRCPNGHRVITIEVTRCLRLLIVRRSPGRKLRFFARKGK